MDIFSFHRWRYDSIENKQKKPSIRLYIFFSLEEEKVQATTLLINSLIFRPTHLGFFDICLLLVILTMATHRNREREREREGKKRKRPSMLLSPQLSTLTFSSFFSSLSLSLLLLVFFACRIILRNQKKNRCTNTFCPLFSSFSTLFASVTSTDAR